MTQFHRLARLDQIAPDRPHAVAFGDRKLVLVRIGQGVRAFDGECPHAGAPLAKGAICDGALICPFHKARFDLGSGQVLDPPALSPLGQYPVRIEDGAVLVGEEKLPPAHEAAAPVGEEAHFVLVGAGTAALAAAQMLRERGFAGRLTMIGPEPTLPYDRTALSKVVLGGDKPVEDLPLLKPAAFFEEHHIARVQASVTRLDATTRRITLGSGEVLDYDVAVVATGAEPKRPDLPGIDLPDVFTLRSKADAEALLGRLGQKPAVVAIIGAGFIAIEAATAIRKQGAEVTLIAGPAAPMASRLGDEVSQAITTLLGGKGVRISKGKAAEVVSQNGIVHGVRLEDSKLVTANLVLVATGVSPRTDFVEGVTHAEDGGIVVDATLRAAPGLYAAGDVATAPLAATGEPARIEHWRVAEQHGRLAARNMLGEDRTLDQVPFFWTFIAGKRFEYLGHAESWDEIVMDGAPADADFAALVVEEGTVRAVIAAGRDTATARLLPHMNDGLDVAAAQAILAG